MNVNNKILSAILILFISVPCTAQDLTIDNIFGSNEFNEKGVWGIRPMNDGDHFSKVKKNEESKLRDILQYDYLDGKETAVLFKGADLLTGSGTTAVDFYNYEFSKDEKQIMLSTGVERLYRHSTKENNFIWKLDDAKLIALSPNGKQRYAKFSPDGSQAAFVRENNIFIVDLSTMKEEQITTDGKLNHIINGATDWVYEEEFGFTRAFFWSPDSKRIAYYRFDETEVPEFNMPKYSGLYPTDNKFKYPKVGEKNAKVSIHIYELETKASKQVDTGMEEEQYIPRIKWTKDPFVLCILKMNRYQNHLELLLANSLGGNVDRMMMEDSKYYIDIDDDLTFLDDGNQFIWTSELGGFNHIYLYDLNGKKVRQITNGDFDVTAFYGVDEDNGMIYYQSAEGSPLERHIYSIGIKGNKKTKLSKSPGTHTAAFSNNFQYYIHKRSSALTPTEVVVRNNKGEKVRVIEDNEDLYNKMLGLGLSNMEFGSFETSGKVSLNYSIIKPPDFDRTHKYPVFMYVYGGPGSQTVKNVWGGSGFLWNQYLAKQGYIVVSIDNRGTGARGEEFKKMTYLQLGKYELEDQVEGAKWLANLPYVDKNRIGIWGWSYGGYMSSLCITKASEHFKMAIAVAPVTHWKFYDTIYTERYMRTTEDNAAGYEDNSPINFVDGLKGKYLIVHGTADDNVHFQNTAEMVDALVNANKQFDVFFYTDKNHSLRGGNARKHLYTKLTDYILNNL